MKKASFEKLKSDLNQTWLIDIELVFCCENGLTVGSNGQFVRLAANVKMASFEKLQSDRNQTWFVDMIWERSYVHAVKGLIPRSKVI